MARTSLSDYFQTFPFWLMDIAPIEPLSLPLFTPLMGFSSISAPEMTLEIHEIQEANNLFTRKIVKRADAGTVTLMRAAKWYDSDFYRWTMAALTGDTGGRGTTPALAVGGSTPRRDLLLIQFLSRTPIPSPGAESAAAAGLLAIQGSATAFANVGVGRAGNVASIAATTAGLLGATGGGLGAGVMGSNYGPPDFAPRIPGKAWILYGCVPSRFKPVSDFDALSSDVSLSELEVAVERWDEISLGSELGAIAVGVTEAAAAAAR